MTLCASLSVVAPLCKKPVGVLLCIEPYLGIQCAVDMATASFLSFLLIIIL